MPDNETLLDLDTKPDPKFRVRVDGQVREYDLYTVLPKLQDLATHPDDRTFVADMESAREAFGFPRLDSGTETVGNLGMVAMVRGFNDFAAKELERLGKLQGRTPNLSGTASAPTTSESSPSTTGTPSPTA